MHGARVLGSRLGAHGLCRRGRQVLRLIGDELRPAACRAESKLRACMFRVVWRIRFDGHAADGIDGRIRMGVAVRAIVVRHACQVYPTGV